MFSFLLSLTDYLSVFLKVFTHAMIASVQFFHLQLGLVEKNIVSYDFDLVASDHSDANSNSTTLFSDDTDDKSRKPVNPEICVSPCQEDEVNFYNLIY